HPAAVAERAEIMDRARESSEQRLELADRLCVAARIDDDVLGARLRAGAADRTIEHHMAGLGERPFGRGFVVERERAGLDDDACARACADDGLDGIPERAWIGQARDDGWRLGD